MFEVYFFVLGLANSLFLTSIFVLRKKRLDIIAKVGWTYLLLAIPAACGLFLAVKEGKAPEYGIFLGIFLAFLLFEWLLDYRLKINFRENIGKNLKWAVPYLALYYAMNYGFVIMPWKTSTAWGFIMLALFAVQMLTNLRSHPRTVVRKMDPDENRD
jgi:hypothetical protein